MDIIDINKLALSYAISCIPRVKEICKPLTEYLGINCFGYMKIYNDCSYFALINGHEAYLRKHHETIQTQDEQFSDNMRKMTYGGPHYSIWQTEYEKLPPIISLHDEFNIWHGFSINYRYQDYIECFAFAFDKTVDNKSQFYLQNLQLLTKFCDYFRIQASNLIDSNSKNKIAIYKDKFDISYIKEREKDRQRFFNEINKIKNHQLINKSGNLISLTQRESDCISILMQNRTMKEIGKALDLSPRTVEHYIENIKQKLEIKYKSQLVDAFSNIYKA